MGNYKNHENHIIPLEINEKYENFRIPYENQEIHWNPTIHLEINENHENLGISCEYQENY